MIPQENHAYIIILNIHVHDVHQIRASLFGGKSLFYFGGGIVIMKNQSAKRVNMLYKNRSVRSPEDGYQLLKQFLGGMDREYFFRVLFGHKESTNSHQYLSQW